MPAFASAMIAAAAGSLALSASDVPPRVPVDPGPAPWERPFSLVAGGGTTPAAAGVVAGDADLGRVWGGARDRAGRVIVATTSGLWLVGTDGRLRKIRGVRQDELTRSAPIALRTLPDGRVAIADRLGRRVVALAPGSGAVTPLATVAATPEQLGLDRDGRLVAVAGDRVLRLRGNALVPDGAPLVPDLPLHGLGVGGVVGGLLTASVFRNLGVQDDPNSDRSSLQVLRADGEQTTVFAPPSPSSIRSLAVLTDGRALLATNALVAGQLDTRRLVLAAGPTLDRQSFDYAIGETYVGWISRRRTLLRRADGALRRVRWAGPPADALAPDGARDLLVASAGRLWTTRAGLGAPEVGRLARRLVGVRLGSPATVTVTVRSDRGVVRIRTPPTRLSAGRSLVKLPGSPEAETVRVTVTASRAGRRNTSSAWAFAGASAFTPRQADRVLSAVARRLYDGFDGAAHGADRCAARSRTVVTCRWTTGGDDGRFAKGGDAGPQTTRSVRLTRSPAGYELLAGEPRQGPEEGRNRFLLGPAVDVR